jgi:cysteine desulfurase
MFALSNLSKKLPERKQVIISAIEHKCVIEATAFWAKLFKLNVVTLGVDEEGYVDLAELAAHLKTPTLFCSIMLVNNEVGTIQDIAIISEMLNKEGVYLHSDCAQALRAVDCRDICDLVDVATFSGHKIGGPQGIGCAYIAGNLQTDFAALTFGGGQQNGLRSGTLPLPLVVGLSKAFELFSDETDAALRRKGLAKLRDNFWCDLKKKMPNIRLNGPQLGNRHPANLNVFLPGVLASDLLMALQPLVCASSGSACSSGSVEPSYVLDALYTDLVRAQSSVRLSLDIKITERELSGAVESISMAYQKLRDF